MPGFASSCDLLQLSKVAGTGLELSQESSENSIVDEQGGAESGALGAQNGPIGPDLAVVVEAWPGLPEAIKVGILAMIRAAR